MSIENRVKELLASMGILPTPRRVKMFISLVEDIANPKN
jgi:hypothetical protein